MSRALLILGNGKTLEKYPFTSYQIDTLGMSQAYRYWDKIGWYPTYYVCLDKNVNQHFGNDICRLIKNRQKYGIKKFMLNRTILKQYPSLINNPDIYFVENLNKPKTRGFSGDSQITSGSYGVRFGIFLGYQKIYLLGIDAHYKPINIKWVKSITDINQRLKVTVDPEPDYFFVGYRSKGDYFHLPPQRRWKKRYNHLQTFQKVNSEFNRNRNNPMVINCNPESMLKKAHILPFQPFPTIYLSLSDQEKLKNLSPIQPKNQLVDSQTLPLPVVAPLPVVTHLPVVAPLQTKNIPASKPKNINSMIKQRDLAKANAKNKMKINGQRKFMSKSRYVKSSKQIKKNKKALKKSIKHRN